MFLWVDQNATREIASYQIVDNYIPFKYTHACTNERYSLANLQDLIPTLARILFGYTAVAMYKDNFEDIF